MGAAGYAQLITDDFSYPNGSLYGQGGGTGWSSAWFATSGSAATNANVVSGRILLDSSSNESAQRTTTTVLWPTDGSSAYLGFVMRLENSVASGASGGFTAAVPSGNTLSWGFGILNNAIRITGQNTQNPANNFFTPFTDYQFVMRLTRNDAGLDTSTLWVNPTSEADTPLRSAVNSFLVPNSTAPQSIILAPQSGTFSYDNLRLGTAFGQVVPEPGTAVLIFIAGGFFAGLPRHRGRRDNNRSR